MGVRWVVLLAALISGCASVNPLGTADGKSAHLLGRRAIVYPATRLKEHVYFVQLNKTDLRDRWGDYPWDMKVPAGKANLIVTCEWYNTLMDAPLGTTARRISQKFIVGHEYQFSSKFIGDGICEVSVVDTTAAEYQAENKAKEDAAQAKKDVVTQSAAKKETTKKIKKKTKRKTRKSRR